MSAIDSLLAEVKHCTRCEQHLPHRPRPLLQVSPSAKILIAGQAPGRKAHASGVSFDDPSGDRLRQWMGISREVFYDASRVALLPMGFCYPGKGKSGDLPPRRECEPAWREQLLAQMPEIRLTLVLGQYAQRYHFGSAESSLTERVKSWRSWWPETVPLPQPEKQ